MTYSRIFHQVLALGLMALLASPGAMAQNYPNKPIKFIVPFPAGSATDNVGRILAQAMGEALGQSITIENKAGANGILGAEAVKASPADGYTFLVTTSTTQAANVHLYRKLSYDPVKDFTPIGKIGETGFILMVNTDFPAKDMKEFIAYAKQRPGALNSASAGIGAVNHLGTEYFNLLTGTKLVHVPYRGGGPALRAVIGNEAQISFTSLVPTLPHVKSGRLRALGITTPKRSALLPDVPSVSETVPGFDITHWYGMWGPKGMPRNVVALWNKEIGSLVNTPEMQRRLRVEGLEPAGGPPSQMYNIVKRDVNKWRSVMKKAGIQQAR